MSPDDHYRFSVRKDKPTICQTHSFSIGGLENEITYHGLYMMGSSATIPSLIFSKF